MKNRQRYGYWVACFLFGSFFSSLIFGQGRDTLSFYSEVFSTERSIVIEKPEFYRYTDEHVALPIIILLDAQHEWFIEPSLNTIKYLQYTHEIPNALVVSIPLTDRVQECAIRDLSDKTLPLHRFITEEVLQQLRPYSTNPQRILIGHSFSASFALYSSLKAPDFYAAIIAHSPLNELESVVKALSKQEKRKAQICISMGGPQRVKDQYHRNVYEGVRLKHPDFFKDVLTYESPSASHTAIPISANPILLSQLFSDFSLRLASTARVDLNYQLVDTPASVAEEMAKVNQILRQSTFQVPLEVAEINGLASRYWNSGYLDHTQAVYEKGVELYPTYFEFHWMLGVLAQEKEEYARAKSHLEKAKDLLLTMESGSPEQEEYLEEIQGLLDQRSDTER
jgi:hypothetical protein